MNWLLLRGLGREHRHWHGFDQALASALGGAQVLGLDLPGTGDALDRRARWSVEAIAADVGRQWSIRGVDRGLWFILGLSLGAMVALELCRTYAFRIRGAVLINSSSALTSPLLRLRPSALPRVARAILERDPAPREEQILSLTSSLPSSRKAQLARAAAGFYATRPMKRRVVLTQLTAAARFHPPRVACPLMMLCSTRDRLVDPACSRQLASWAGAPIFEHPTAGHDLPLDDPAWAIDKIRAWLETV